MYVSCHLGRPLTCLLKTGTYSNKQSLVRTPGFAFYQVYRLRAIWTLGAICPLLESIADLGLSIAINGQDIKAIWRVAR